MSNDQSIKETLDVLRRALEDDDSSLNISLITVLYNNELFTIKRIEDKGMNDTEKIKFMEYLGMNPYLIYNYNDNYNGNPINETIRILKESKLYTNIDQQSFLLVSLILHYLIRFFLS